MKSQFQPTRLKAQSQREGFDVSYQWQCNQPFGALLPCGFWRVNPNDKFNIAPESQTICDALARPAFMRLKQHIDYYFIPATQIWMPFDNFITGQDSYFSTAVRNIQNTPNFVPSQVPVFDGEFLFNVLKSMLLSNDELGYNQAYGAVRLLDQLNYCNLNSFVVKGTLDDSENEGLFNQLPDMNFFALACYQKVYYDYFRNPKYEDNVTSAYNLDDLQSREYTINDALDNPARFIRLFRMHYRWMKKDYFTQVQPNVLPSSDQIGYSGLPNDLQSVDGIFGIPGSFGSSVGYKTTTSNVPSSKTYGTNVGRATNIGRLSASSGQDGAYGISVANIRAAFAYDRLLRRMREAGADFDKQMLAQFGIAPIDPRHGKCSYIGGFTNDMQTGSVTNMTGDDIGQLAGQINCYCDNTKHPLSYHVREHGFVIAVMSYSCENTYQSYRVARENVCRDRFDWFNPVYEDLGLQPLFQFEMDYTNPTTQVAERGTSINQPEKLREVLGYVPRYSEYKTRPDEIHGLMCIYSGIGDLMNWNMQYYRNQWKSGITQATTALTIRDLLLDPAMMDNVAGVEYNGDPRTDHFIINMYHHFRNVSSMSRKGEIF